LLLCEALSSSGALVQETHIPSKGYMLAAMCVMQVTSSIHSKLDWCSEVNKVGTEPGRHCRAAA